MKEKILEAFDNLGFKLKEEDISGSYTFSYEDLNLMYTYNENDEDFLSISLPGIIELKDYEPWQVYALLEKINSTLKYVKAYIIGDYVWLFYERELFADENEHENLMMIISRMILHLEAGLIFARKAMEEIENGNSSENSSDNQFPDEAEELVEDPEEKIEKNHDDN